MKLLDEQDKKLLLSYFDKTATFKKSVKTRDKDTGEVFETFEPIESLTMLKVAVGNVPVYQQNQGQHSDLRLASLDYEKIVNVVDTTCVVEIVNMGTYKIDKRLVSQSEDVIEFNISKWL